MNCNCLNEENRPILSVVVPTYNHERYIATALDSILKQKTSFNFEIIVGDDASIDNTPKIIMQYVKQYPDRIIPVLRKNNSYQKKTGLTNASKLFNIAKGKYIIALEGDDFWTDSNKLQTQVDFLEKNPDFIAVAHRVVVVGEDDLPNGEQYPESKKEYYTFKDFAKGILPGQTATLMYRNIYQNNNIDLSILEQRLIPGDRLKVFVLLTYGKIYCIPKVMSCYRHVKKGGSSFSANNKYDFERLYNWNLALMKYAQKNESVPEFAVQISEYFFLKIILSGLKRKKLKFIQFLKEFKKIKYKFKVHMFLFKYGFK